MQETKRDELGWPEFLDILWRGRLTILIITLTMTVLAGIGVLVLPKRYRASTVMEPVASTNAGGLMGSLSSVVSQYGDIASLAGIAGSVDAKKSESIAVLQSELLTERYIQEQSLLPELFHSKWDDHRKRWKSLDPDYAPTLWKGNQYFKKHVRTVSNDLKTGLVALYITWRDPITAAKWANDLVLLTNEYLRNKAISQSEANIDFLNTQAEKTTEVGIKSVIYHLMETEINKAMLARSTQEYAFKVIDPARPPEKPDFPDPLIFLPTGFIGGLLLSVLVLLIRAK